MEDFYVQVCARLTSHGFVLEVLAANLLAQAADPRANTERFCVDLVDRARTRSELPEGLAPTEDSAKIEAESTRVLERFAERVRARVDNITS